MQPRRSCCTALHCRSVRHNMLMKQFRSSTTFAVLVVCVAVFTDIFLYGLVVPMLPFALAERVGLTDADIQHWNSILLASYGASIMLGSCELFIISRTDPYHRHLLTHSWLQCFLDGWAIEPARSSYHFCSGSGLWEVRHCSSHLPDHWP